MTSTFPLSIFLVKVGRPYDADNALNARVVRTFESELVRSSDYDRLSRVQPQTLATLRSGWITQMFR